MRLQLASDLHLEFLKDRWPAERIISPAPSVDALVLAGDIANGTDAIELFREWPVPVIYVAGNHEPYGHDIDEVRELLRARAEGTSIRFLERDAAVLGEVRFLGCTLWTDYRYRCNRTQRQIMEVAELRINDHRVIRSGEGRLTADRALSEHEASREWLDRELAKPCGGATVVVTHHAPHPMSVHPRYAGDALNGAFVSDLSDLLRHADLWLHGHVHDSFDYTFGRCRVVANPAGYAMNVKSAGEFDEVNFENAAFDDALVIETDPSNVGRRA